MLYKLQVLFITSLFMLRLDAQKDTIPALREVIVKSSRMNTSGRHIPFSHSIVDSTIFLRQNGRSVPEMLDGTPGVFIQKTSHGGGSPFVRGLTGNQNLILIDGIRLNNAIFRYGPNQYLTLLDPLSVERIEVVKGTGSVQYGSDALGGVINVITQMPAFSNERKWSGRTDLRWTSSAMEKSVRQQMNFSSQRFAVMMSAGYSDFGDLLGGDTTGYQRPSGYLQKSMEAKIKYNAGKGWVVNAGITGVRQGMVPLFHKYSIEKFRQSFSDPLERGLMYTQVQKTFRGRKIQQLSMQFSNQQMNERRISQAGTGSTISFESDRIKSMSAQAEVVWKFNENWISRLGIEWNRDNIFSSREQLNTNTGILTPRRGLYPDGAIYQHAALYNIHQLKAGKWQLELGWRYHAYHIRLEEVTLGKVSVKTDALVLLSGASYAINDKMVLFGNLSTGYRAPNIDDMGTLGIIDFRYEVPSYGLLPEKSINKEIGIRYHSTRWRWSGSLFHTNLSNLINRVKTNEVIAGYNVFIKENNERAFIQGLEFESRYQLSSYLSMMGMLSYLYGKNISKAEPVRRIPPFNGFFALQYQQKKFNAGISCEQALAQRRLAQGDKDDNRIPAGGTPGYLVFHWFAGGNWKQFHYRFFLNNLMNADYRKHGSGVNGMGRSLTFTLQYAFN